MSPFSFQLLLTLAMFRKAGSAEPLFGVSFSLEHSCHESLPSDLSISTMPLPLCCPSLCWLFFFSQLLIHCLRVDRFCFHVVLHPDWVCVPFCLYCKCSVFVMLILIILRTFCSIHSLRLSCLASTICRTIGALFCQNDHYTMFRNVDIINLLQ